MLDYSVAIEAFLSLFDHHETDQVPDLEGVLVGEGLGLVVDDVILELFRLHALKGHPKRAQAEMRQPADHTSTRAS